MALDWQIMKSARPGILSEPQSFQGREVLYEKRSVHAESESNADQQPRTSFRENCNRENLEASYVLVCHSATTWTPSIWVWGWWWERGTGLVLQVRLSVCDWIDMLHESHSAPLLSAGCVPDGLQHTAT